MTVANFVKTRGFFDVQDLHTLASQTDISVAKAIAMEIIHRFQNATKANVAKVTAAVQRCQTVEQLASVAANFLLAHPSENLSMRTGESKARLSKKRKLGI